jgi:uncharacterized membrane protein YoaK (UPF0700 family)
MYNQLNILCNPGKDLRKASQNLISADVYSDSSIEVAALLTFSGGFLDVFTYLGHGGVFANSMTGNIVFLGMYAAAGQWQLAAQHIPPILAFLAGVFIAYHMQLPVVVKHFPKPALTCLALEIFVLLIEAFLPGSFPDILLVLSISLVAAMQNSSFTKLEQWSYNSVMTTGNLRRFAEAIFSSSIPKVNPKAIREAKLFGLVCICFLAGSIIAALTTGKLHNCALLIPVSTLVSAFIICWRRQYARLLSFIFQK